jgi:hypothetical protein
MNIYAYSMVSECELNCPSYIRLISKLQDCKKDYINFPMLDLQEKPDRQQALV